MACLYDANVWVALAFAAHPHPGIASEHFQVRDSDQPAAFCRVTQQAFLRLVSTPVIQRTYDSSLITNADAWEKCQDLLALPQILWLDEPAGFVDQWSALAGLPSASPKVWTDAYHAPRTHGSRKTSASPKVWTDAYLAAFAIGHDLELVTIDSDFKNFEKAGLNLKMLIP